MNLYSADEDIDSKFQTNIVVYHDGNCSWIPLGLYISACSIDIQWFPFDDQFCKMKFGSWTYDGNQINLTQKSGTIDLSTYQVSGEWDLIGESSYMSTYLPSQWDLIGESSYDQSHRDNFCDLSRRAIVSDN